MTAPLVRRPAVLSLTYWTAGPGGDLPAGLHAAWAAAGRLGLTEEIEPHPAQLRAAVPFDHPGRLRVLGARGAGAGPQVEQAYAYQLHDVIGLALMRAPNRDAAEWAALEPAARPGDAIGQATVYLGLLGDRDAPTTHGAAVALGRRLRGLVPGGERGWPGTACGFPAGITAWDVSPGGGDGTGRRLLVLAPERAEDAVDRWVWLDDGPGLPPFALYLLHAAKLRYERAVLVRELPALRRNLAAANEESAALSGVLGSDRGSDRLLAAATRLTDLQTRADGLVDSLARVRTLARTVETAQANLAAVLPQPVYEGDGGPLGDDRRIAGWTAGQLRSEETYLDAATARAGALLGTVTAVVDTGLRARDDGRTLMQTSIIGGLLVALAAVQSLNYAVDLPGPLMGPLILLLTALAMWLPSAVLQVGRAGRVPAGWAPLGVLLLALTAAAAGWTAVTGAWLVRGGPAPPWASVVTAVGAATVAAAAALAYRRRKGRADDRR
ncbi:CATRA conflict system CASPASE/TPR repeat-associated protein [Dactylosporangium sp. NPDC049140]|uniref:CATRA conflict system CASPASE/TPR repeat-associated protein n=1 Tax=Dactylosporangium sp. NPDC049140 TaxID=3155647 RepID=UPI0033E8C4C2